MAKRVPSFELHKAVSNKADANEREIARLGRVAPRRRQVLPSPGTPIRTGIIVCQGPNEETNPSDETYWVQFADHLKTGSDPTINNPVDVDGGDNDIVLATNLDEIEFGSHDLREGTIVELRQVTDDAPQKRWVFNKIPFVWACVFGGLFGATSTHAAENLGILRGANHWYRDLMPVTDPNVASTVQANLTTSDMFWFDGKMFNAGSVFLNNTTTYPLSYFDFSAKKYVGVTIPNVTSGTIGAAVKDEENDCVYLATTSAPLGYQDVYKMTGSDGSYTFTRLNLDTAMATATDNFTTQNLKIITTTNTRYLIWCGSSDAVSPTFQGFARYDLDNVSPSWSAAASGSFSAGATGYDVASNGTTEVFVGSFDDMFGVTNANGVVRVTGGSASAMGSGLVAQSSGNAGCVEYFDDKVWVGHTAGFNGDVSIWNGSSWDDLDTTVSNIGGNGLRGAYSGASYTGGAFGMVEYDRSLVIVGRFQFRQTGDTPQADIPAGGVVKIVKTATDTYEARDVAGGCLSIPYAPQFVQPNFPGRIRVYTIPDVDCPVAFVTGSFSQVSDRYAEYIAGITATAQSKRTRRGGLAGQNNGSQITTPGVYDIKGTVEARGGTCLPTQAFVTWAFGSFSYAINTRQPPGETHVDEIVTVYAVAKQIDGVWRAATSTLPSDRITTGIPVSSQAGDKLVVAGPILPPEVYTGTPSSGSYAELVSSSADPGGMYLGGPTHMLEYDGTIWMAGGMSLLPNPPGTYYALAYYDGSKYVGVSLPNFTSSSLGYHLLTADLGSGMQLFFCGQPDDSANDCPVMVQSVAGTPGTWADVGTNLTGIARMIAVHYGEDGARLIAVGSGGGALKVGATVCESAYWNGTTWQVLTDNPSGLNSQQACGALNYWPPCEPEKRYAVLGGQSDRAEVSSTAYDIRALTGINPDEGIRENFTGVDGQILCFYDASEILATNPTPVKAKFVTESMVNYCDIQFTDFINPSITSTSNVAVYWQDQSYAVSSVARKSGQGHVLRLTLGAASSAVGESNRVEYGASLNSDWKGVIRGLAIEAFTRTLIAG